MKDIEEFDISDITKDLAIQVDSEIENEEEILEEKIEKKKKDKENKKNKKKSKIPKWFKAGAIAFIATCIICIPIIVVLVKLDKINKVDFNDTTHVQDEQFDFSEDDSEEDTNKNQYDALDLNWDNAVTGSTRYDENIVNILLVGTDSRSTQGYRGNSDTMIIFTIDKDNKNVKMTSIMRDLYVPIPGKSDNKINSAYSTGGVPLLKQTIESNFKVAIDYTVIVEFDTFKKVIELLGGVDIEINEKEAKNINKNTPKTCKQLVAGVQHLDAEQALWFSRIRKVSSDIYGSNDFGRTARQRAVLKSIYEEYKNLSVVEVSKLVDEIFPYITTDMSSETILTTAALVLSFGVDEIESFRIPMDRAFEAATVKPNGYKKGMSVLLINSYMKENVNAMHQFIYGNTNY